MISIDFLIIATDYDGRVGDSNGLSRAARAAPDDQTHEPHFQAGLSPRTYRKKSLGHREWPQIVV